MEKKVLTIFDLEHLHYAAEYIISTAQFNFYEFDENGKHIAYELTHEERTARLHEWINDTKNHPLCFRQNEELHNISFSEALEMPLSEIKEKYLKDHLKKLRTILRYDTSDMNDVMVSDDVPDSYLDDLLALRWRGNLVLWAMQWDKESTGSANEEKMRFENLLKQLMMATGVDELNGKREEFTRYIPCLSVMFGYDQQNHAHQYDLWHHCLHTVINLPRNIDDSMLYLSALLHDIGKPDCQRRGKRPDDPNMHYYGHPLQSMEIVRDNVIPALMEKGVFLTADEQRRLLYYVEYHDDRMSLRPKHLRRHLQMASLNEFKKLMLLQVADALSHIMLPVIEERIRICSAWAGEYADEVYRSIIAENS